MGAKIVEAGVEGAGVSGFGVEGDSVFGAGVVGDRFVRPRVVGASAEGAIVAVICVEGAEGARRWCGRSYSRRSHG